MTTATDSPLIDEPSIGVDEMPAWDQPDERVCEIPEHGGKQPPAAWVVTTMCSHCGAATDLMCDACKQVLDAEGAYCVNSMWNVKITRVEPL